jgi:hypothetical protein
MANPAYFTACIYTTVKNITGVTRSFGFLGMHGKTLTVNQEYTEFGDLLGSKFTTDTRTNYRKQKALQVALTGDSSRGIAPMLHVKSSPVSVIFDNVSSLPEVVTITGGALGVADPCWGSGY